MQNTDLFDAFRIPWRWTGGSRLSRASVRFSSRFEWSFDHLTSLRRRFFRETPRSLARTETHRQEKLLESLEWVQGKIRRKTVLTPSRLRELARRLTGEEEPFRSKTIYIKDREGRVLEEFPDPEWVPTLMDTFMEWRKAASRWPPSVKAAGSHLILLSVHPLRDGNGRLSRMIEYWDLALAGHPYCNVIHPELCAHWNLREYYKSLMDSRRCGYIDPHVDFMARSYMLFGGSYKNPKLFKSKRSDSHGTLSDNSI